MTIEKHIIQVQYEEIQRLNLVVEQQSQLLKEKDEELYKTRETIRNVKEFIEEREV